jgi:multidrug efflux pump
VLVAVFLPVGFLQGNTGRLFRELSVALAARWRSRPSSR